VTLISVTDVPSPAVRWFYELGYRLLTKQAADPPRPAYVLSGMLFHKQGENGDWIMLGVPNALVRGVFAAMDEAGVELPPSGPGEQLEAHISVMRPEELARIGGPDRISERGKRFRYRLGGLVEVTPHGWPEMSKCWMLRVHSPDLQRLRRSYGLTSLPKDGQFDFHITVAVRRKSVLGRNESHKGETS